MLVYINIYMVYKSYGEAPKQTYSLTFTLLWSTSSTSDMRVDSQEYIQGEGKGACTPPPESEEKKWKMLTKNMGKSAKMLRISPTTPKKNYF